MKTSIPRLRRVRFKSGGFVEVLRQPRTDSEFLRAEMTRLFQVIQDEQGPDLAGFALMVWGPDGSSSAVIRTDGTIPLPLIADFVRGRLIIETQRIVDGNPG